MQSYTNLHAHTDHSIRDGLCSVEKLVERSVELGMKHVAISDHGNMSAFPYLVKECKKHNVNPIIGSEFYVVDERDETFHKRGEKRDHIILIAKNWNGLQKLFRITSKANRNKYYGYPRLTYQYLLKEDLSDLYVSGACSIGFLKRDNYEEYVKAFYEKCGDSFYLEILPISYLLDGTDIDGGRVANERAIEMHKKYSIQLVATQDSHYAYKEDSQTHQVLLAINSRAKMDDPNRWTFDEEGQLYIKSLPEFAQAFKDLGYIEDQIVIDAILNTNNIAENIKIDIPEFYVSLPTPYPGEDDNKMAMKIIMRFWEKYGLDKKPNKKELMDRLKHELGVINKFGLIRYFLIIADLYDFLREAKIPYGAGRGSCGGSMLAYLMGIIDLNPIDYDLIFERFLNEGRLHRETDENGIIQLTADGLPDIDIDVSKDRRSEVIEYIKKKYGEEHVSQLSTFNYFTPKSAFKAVASAYSITSKENNTLSKLIEEGSYLNEEGDEIPYPQVDSWTHVKELSDFKERYPEIVDISLKLNKTINSMGKHASGIVVSSTPLKEIGPIDVRNEAEIITYNLKIAEGMFSMLKLDLLGIATADVIDNSCDLVGIKRDDIPLDDPKAIDILAKGDSTGLFQMESGLGKQTLKEINNGSIMDVSIVSSIIRPGCLSAVMPNGKTAYKNYIERVQGKQPVSYTTAKLEPILKETQGIYVFQEQVIRTFNKLAGFSLAEADIIRKAIGKKELGVIESYKEQFINGCVENEVSKNQAKEVFNSIIKSSTYLFNKSHAVAYSISTMRSAYLKANYPAQFFTSLLTYNSKDEDGIAGYITEAARYGVTVIYPDINKSHASDFVYVDDKTIASPLSCVKNVGEKASEAIVSVRDKIGGMFVDYGQFEEMIKEHKAGRVVNKRVKDHLLRVNAFENIGSPVDDPEKLQEDLRSLLGLFSPIPSIKGGRTYEKDQLAALYGQIGECCNSKHEGSQSIVEPIIYSKSSVLVVTGLSKNDSKLLQKKNTKWFQKHMSKELGIANADISYTCFHKCAFYGTDPGKIPKDCINLCREYLINEIKIIRPRMIVACQADLYRFLIEDSKAKFLEDYGKIKYSGLADAYVVACPSPQYIDYKDEAREGFNESVMPLMKKCFA